jgi:hypothetical protein
MVARNLAMRARLGASLGRCQRCPSLRGLVGHRRRRPPGGGTGPAACASITPRPRPSAQARGCRPPGNQCPDLDGYRNRPTPESRSTRAKPVARWRSTRRAGRHVDRQFRPRAMSFRGLVPRPSWPWRMWWPTLVVPRGRHGLVPVAECGLPMSLVAALWRYTWLHGRRGDAVRGPFTPTGGARYCSPHRGKGCRNTT